MGMPQPITLTWDGKDYVIPEDKVMRCVGLMEEEITIGEVLQTSAGRVKTVKIAYAFATALNFAAELSNGKLPRVSPEAVRAGMFAGGTQQTIAESVTLLLKMMIPPEAFKMTGGVAEANQGNVPSRQNRRAAASSKKRSK